MFEKQFVTYAQNGEDVLLWRALKHVSKGFYIDVGAQDPVMDSVTKAFYDRGWRGINIEPVPRWYERLAQDRPHDINLRLAVSDRPGTVKLFEVEDTGLSTSDSDFAQRHRNEGRELREHQVVCATLDQVCADNDVDKVHFLKVDCEGAEKQVLKGISLADVRPWIILVEATEPNSTKPTWQQWQQLLTRRGYRFVFFDGLNRYYLADEHMELAPAFAAPVNVFDSATRASDVNMQKELDHLQGELEGLKRAAANAELRTELAAVTSERDRLHDQQMELRHHSETLMAERDQLQGRHAELQRQVVTFRAERDQLQDRHAESQRRADLLTTECENLQVQWAALQHEVDAYREESKRLQENLAALLSSSSWRVSAPLRVGSRVLRWTYRRSRRMAYLMLRPFAHMARPMLRWLSGNGLARRLATGLLGKRSRITRLLRLFLFGAAPVNDVGPGVPRRPADQGDEQASVRIQQVYSDESKGRGGASAPTARFDLDAVMERVRAEVARRRGATEAAPRTVPPRSSAGSDR